MKRICSFLCALTLLVSLSTPAFAAKVETDVSFRAPAGLLATQDGTRYLTDSEAHQILSVAEDGAVSVAAGYTLPNDAFGRPTGGYLDSDAKDALFNGPTALVEWLGGIAISDTGNHCLRLLKDGQVRTLAGNGSEGLKNGSGESVRFSAPMGLTVDDDGNLYIADSGNGVIRKMTQKGKVTTYAEGFEMPAGLAWYDGALYVADAGSNRILTVKSGRTEVLAGSAVRDGEEWSSGFSDGPAKKASFFQPMDLWVTEDAVYIADSGNGAVRVLRDGRVSTMSHNADGKALYPAEPVALALVEDTLYVADHFAGVVYGLNTGGKPYADVAKGDWYHDAIHSVTNMGLMAGTGNDRFSPNGKFTRAMMAVVLMRYEESRDRDAILSGKESYSDITPTTWYADAAAWITQAGLMSGYPNGTFGGNDPLTRQQCAAVLYRYAEKLGMDMSTNEDLSEFYDAELISGYAVEPLRWAVSKGIMGGYGDGRLAPEQNITRAQLCVMLYR